MSPHGGATHKEIVQGLLHVNEIQHLRFHSLVNVVLGLAATAFSAISLVLLVLNGLLGQCQEAEGCVKVMSEVSFHLLEFWAAFLFNVTNVFVLIFSDKTGGQRQFPIVFKVMVFVSISASLVSATLVSINLDVFGTPSHELEYANELTMAFLDAAFLLWFLRSGSASVLARGAAVLAGAVGLSVAVIQLAIFNGMGWENGHPKGEVAAHYFEFSLGILVGLVTASFAFDNKFRCDARLEELLDLGCLQCPGSCDSDERLKETASCV